MVRDLQLVMSAVLLSACASTQTERETTPPSAEQPDPLVVVSPELWTDARAPIEERGLRAVVSEASIDDGSARAETSLERALEHYRDFEFDESLAAIEDAVEVLEASARAGEDFVILRRALLQRAMSELALERGEAALLSVRAAATFVELGPVEEAQWPPEVRTLFEEALGEVASAPNAHLSLTSEPPGAHVFLDGEEVGRSPFSGEVAPGRHYLRIEVLGFATDRELIDLEPEDRRDVHMTLRPAGNDELGSQLRVDAIEQLSESERESLAAASDAEVLWSLSLGPMGQLQGRTLSLVDGEARYETVDVTEETTLSEAVDELLTALTGEVTPYQPPPSRRERVLRSPWLWAGIGLVLAGGLATVIGVVATQETDPQVILTPDP